MVAANPPALCPNIDALQAFCQGDVSEAELERVADHLQACTSCAALLTQLESEPDPLVVALRRSAQHLPSSNDPLLDQLQARQEGALPVTATPLSFQLPCQLGKYELLELLGGGGMGVVYRARQTSLQRIVAIKVLSPRLGEAPAVVRRFQEEIRLVGSLGLRQPHLVLGLDADIADGRAFLVMEHIDGIDLARLVRSVGPLPFDAVGEIGYQAAQGLQSLHELGLVHRDVKPSNMMLADGVIRLLDFGLARVAGEREDVSDLTSSDQFLGTVDYVSPEQIQDPRCVDSRADIYSLGCTLFFLLTGHAPFVQKQSRADKVRAHRKETPPDIRRLRPDVPQELANVIMRMLEKDPQSRFAHPADVVRDLQPFADRGQLRELTNLLSPSPRRTGTEPTEEFHRSTARPTPTLRRSRLLISSLSIAVALLVVVIGISFGPWSANPTGIPEPESPPINAVEVTHSVVPRTLFVSKQAANSFFQINEGTNALHLVSNDLQLVKLGTLDREDAVLEIAVDVGELKSQSGEAGVFVGWRDRADHQERQFQLIHLQEYGNRDLYSRRVKHLFDPQTPNSRTTRGFLAVKLPRKLRVNTLRLEVIQGTLQQLSWNGQSVETFGSAQSDETTGKDIQGVFGVYADNAVAVFTDYRLNDTTYEFKQVP
jgi:serine/threonine protein kinase